MAAVVDYCDPPPSTVEVAPDACWHCARRPGDVMEVGPVVTDSPLRFLHSEAILSQVKLAQFRMFATAELIESLRPGQSGSLRAKADGTVLEGHRRLVVLRERGVDIDALPRELFPRKPES